MLIWTQEVVGLTVRTDCVCVLYVFVQTRVCIHVCMHTSACLCICIDLHMRVCVCLYIFGWEWRAASPSSMERTEVQADPVSHKINLLRTMLTSLVSPPFTHCHPPPRLSVAEPVGCPSNWILTSNRTTYCVAIGCCLRSHDLIQSNDLKNCLFPIFLHNLFFLIYSMDWNIQNINW